MSTFGLRRGFRQFRTFFGNLVTSLFFRAVQLKLGKSKRGLSKRGLKRRRLGPKRPFRGNFCCLLRSCEVGRNRSQSAPKRLQSGPKRPDLPGRIFARFSLKIWGLRPRLTAPVWISQTNDLLATTLGLVQRSKHCCLSKTNHLNFKQKLRIAWPLSRLSRSSTILTQMSESVKCRFRKCRFSAELEKLEKMFKMGCVVEK